MDDKAKVHAYWDEIFATQQWTEGTFHDALRGQLGGLERPAVARVLELERRRARGPGILHGLAGKTVLCPSNTFMATPLAIAPGRGPGRVRGLQPRGPLPVLRRPQKARSRVHKPAAVWVVHIGGHIAFEIEEISRFCRERGIILLEDCAHAHGASWNGRKPGTWGAAGVYSFYATKTITTGEGGILVTADPGLLEYAKRLRNYGKPDYAVHGLNYRINEFAAALGAVQVERMPDIVALEKSLTPRAVSTRNIPNRVKFPGGMVSGYYKYIVFDPIEKSTGKVYDQPCHKLMGRADVLPETELGGRAITGASPCITKASDRAREPAEFPPGRANMEPNESKKVRTAVIGLGKLGSSTCPWST